MDRKRESGVVGETLYTFTWAGAEGLAFSSSSSDIDEDEVDESSSSSSEDESLSASTMGTAALSDELFVFVLVRKTEGSALASSQQVTMSVSPISKRLRIAPADPIETEEDIFVRLYANILFRARRRFFDDVEEQEDAAMTRRDVETRQEMSFPPALIAFVTRAGERWLVPSICTAKSNARGYLLERAEREREREREWDEGQKNGGFSTRSRNSPLHYLSQKLMQVPHIHPY
jgi:hypothetical protein